MRYFAVRTICGLYHRRPRRLAKGLRRADCGLWANGGNKANSGRSSAGRKGSPVYSGRWRIGPLETERMRSVLPQSFRRTRLSTRPQAAAPPVAAKQPGPSGSQPLPRSSRASPATAAHCQQFVDLARQRASKLVNFVFMLRRTPSEHEAQERRRCDGPLSFARLLSA
jgi:hypothetical protein